MVIQEVKRLEALSTQRECVPSKFYGKSKIPKFLELRSKFAVDFEVLDRGRIRVKNDASKDFGKLTPSGPVAASMRRAEKEKSPSRQMHNSS